MLKKFLCFVSIILVFVQSAVYADEVFYTNNYGLPFSEFQYNAMVDMLGEDNVAEMTYEEYELHRIATISEDTYDYVVYDETEDVNSKASFHETNCKRISIAKVCNNSYCLIDLNTMWKCIPSIKSYDVTGVRLSNTNFYSDRYSMYAKMNGSLQQQAGTLGASNGVGFAFKIVSSGDIDYATVTVETRPQGFVYGSYQHSIKNISLTAALDFTFNSSGYGSVFLWPRSYGQIFDQMSGVAAQLSS